MRRHRLLITILVCSLGLFQACSTRTVLKPNPQPKTSYEMLIPDTALRYSLTPGETAVQPMPDKQVAPVYPSSLLHPDAAPVTVVAQLVMDKQGHVQGVYPVSDTAAKPDRASFEAAVERAAMQWTFTPLWMRKPNGDGTYDLTAKPFSLWYVFHFKVVDGKPIVETVKR
ncbi:MAG TPA: hypothetical protein VHA71_02175 [Rhodanobacteraceae bacterium]|jgi:hypothetical protein|nr:hypothetical protein [Rhodanobacteraceae bacterium]